MVTRSITIVLADLIHSHNIHASQNVASITSNDDVLKLASLNITSTLPNQL